MNTLETAGIVLLTWTTLSLGFGVVWSMFMSHMHRKERTLVINPVRSAQPRKLRAA